MPNTFELIASSTVGAGGAASIDFTSIPSTFTDLVVKLSARNTQTNANWGDVQLRPNGATTGFTAKAVFGYSGTTASNTDTNPSGGFTVRNSTANTFSNIEVYIPNYTSSVAKSWSLDAVTEANGVDNAITWLGANLWSGTATITSLNLVSIQGSFAQYSTAYLYGVKNA